jgi:hypothetical protein
MCFQLRRSLVDYVRYNTRTCEKDIEIDSKLDISIIYVGSLFNNNQIKDLYWNKVPLVV